MAARAIWKGHLRLSLVTVAVSLVPATSDRARIHFHMLNPDTHNRVKQQLVDAETGDVVERKRVEHGVEVRKGDYVVVGDDELDRLKIASSHTIDIERFVDRAAVDPAYHSRRYYLVPDGRVAAQAYAVLREAMRRQNKLALGRLVLAAREHVVAIEPHDNGLSLTTLRDPAEVRAPKTVLGGLKDGKLDADMVRLAESLIVDKTGALDPALFEDRYQAALRALIEAKAKGRKPSLPTARPPGNVVNLMDALRRSVRRTGVQQARKSRARRKTA